MAKEIKEVKAAKPAKATKTPNPESFFNKFAKPVGKLGLVGALTAGAIGFVNELTYEKIAQNWYEQSLASYLELGDAFDWERNDTNFNVVTEGTSGGVSEYMVYCDSTQAEACTAEASDVSGYTFKYDGPVSTFGTMSMQVAVEVLEGIPVMADYRQLGFVHSFGVQAAEVISTMDQMVVDGVEVAGGSFNDLAGATSSIATLNTAFTDIRTTYDAVAADPTTLLSTAVDNIVSLGSIADHAGLKAKIEDATTNVDFVLENNVSIGAILPNNEYAFIVRWMGYGPYRTDILVVVDATGTFEWASLDKTRLASSNDGGYGGCGTLTECGNQEAVDWINAAAAAGVDNMPSATLAGASPDQSTLIGMETMKANIEWFKDTKGGLV